MEIMIVINSHNHTYNASYYDIHSNQSTNKDNADQNHHDTYNDHVHQDHHNGSIIILIP